MKNKKTAALLLALLIAAGTVAGCSSPETNVSIPENSSEVSTINDSSVESQSETASNMYSSPNETSELTSNSSETANTSKESTSSSSESSRKPSTNNSSSSAISNSNNINMSKNPSSNSGSGSSSNSSSGNSGSGSTSKPSSKPVHTHSYTSKTVKATCTSGGYTVHTCSCGNSYTDGYTDALGHKWGSWTTVKKATTSSEGKQQRTCSSCGKTESKTIAKLPSSSSSSGGHAITGARKAVYSYRGMDSFSSVNLVDLINEERRKEGLCDLEWTADLLRQDLIDDPDLASCYGDYCFDSNGNFDPYLVPEVREPLQGAQKMADMGFATHDNGVGCSCVGEANGYATIEDALRGQIKAYMNSPAHRKSLMNAGSHSVTAAYAIDANGKVYTAIRVGG